MLNSWLSAWGDANILPTTSLFGTYFPKIKSLKIWAQCSFIDHSLLPKVLPDALSSLPSPCSQGVCCLTLRRGLQSPHWTLLVHTNTAQPHCVATGASDWGGEAGIEPCARSSSSLSWIFQRFRSLWIMHLPMNEWTHWFYIVNSGWLKTSTNQRILIKKDSWLFQLLFLTLYSEQRGQDVTHNLGQVT